MGDGEERLNDWVLDGLNEVFGMVEGICDGLSEREEIGESLPAISLGLKDGK